MQIRTYLTLACLAVFSTFNLTGQTTQYIGPNNGDWFNPANWNAGLPVAGNNALIGGGVTVAVGSPLTIDFSLTAFGNISASAAVTVASGGSIANSGSMSFAASGSLTNNATVQNFGTMAFAGTAGFNNNAGANFTNGGSLSLEATSVNQGNFTNNGTIDAPNGIFQTGGSFNNNQLLTTRSLTLNMGGSFTNNFGAVLTITGATGLLKVDGSFTNNGILNAAGTMTINGSLNNNVALNLALATVLTISPGAQLNNGGTLDNNGSVQINGTFTNNLTLINRGEVNNFATFNNNNLVDNRTGASFFNRPAGTLGMGFGSKILNAGTFTNQNALNSFGRIENNGSFINTGTLLSFGGSLIDNNATFANNSTLSTNDVVSNDGTFTNAGTVNVNGGSVWSNNGNFTNALGGTVNVVQDFNNKATGMLSNNGRFNNAVRTRNEGSFANNAYLFSPGDFTNMAGAVLTNNELFNFQAGNLLNAGTFINTDKTLVDKCSSVNNTGSINNTGGNFELHGIFFQKGTITGNALNNQGGYTHTAATSAAPTICQNGTYGADINGDIKVYASSLVAFANFDSCANIVYFANGLARPVFRCSDIPTIQNVNLVVRTRLGDSLTCVAQVTPVDLLAPVFSNCPKSQTIYTPNGTTPANWTAPTATDNCSTVTLTTTHAPGTSFPVGITTVTYTAKDVYNNQNQCQFRIDVRQTPPGSNCEGDAAGPTFSGCPSNISTPQLAALTVATWTPPTPADNCKPINLTSTHEPGQVFAVGTTTVTYTAKDGNNNSSTCSFTVTITTTNPCANDTQKPTILGCPANILLPTNTNINGAVAIWNVPSAGDNCGLANFTASHAPGSVFPVGTTTVTYTATDAANNAASCSFSIIVGTDPCPGDNTGPTISGCPANINLVVPGASATATWTAPTATDPCAPVTVNTNYAPGSTFPLGTTTVSYQFSDKKGNKRTCNFNVTVQNSCAIETVPPVITGCPANITVDATGLNGATASWTPPTATDNCGLSSFGASFLPGSNFPVGTTNVIYSAIDLKGNAATCQFTILVQNLPPPSVTCKNHTAFLGENGQANISPSNVYQSGTSSVGQLVLQSVSPNSFDCSDLGNNPVQLTVIDGNGRTATCNANVVVALSQSSLLGYTILAQDEIHMHKNTVVGNLGVWKAGKEARIHDATTVNGFVRSPIIDLTGGSTISSGQNLAQAPMPPLASFKYNTMPDPPSDVKVPDNFVGVYLLNGTNFKKIEIGKNATAKFTATGTIYVKEFITKDSDNGKKSSVQFSGNTELVVKKKVELGKRTELNWGSPHRVKIYEEEENVVIKESCKVAASIDVRFKDLKVDDATEQNPSLLQGQFIAKKVDAKKWVNWSWSPFECGALPTAAPLIGNNDNSDFAVSLDMEQVQLTWITNTDHKSDRYIVERSTNGTDFEPLMEIAPETDGTQASLYTNHDAQPNLGTNFYRVRTVFADATEALSEVRAVELNLDRTAVTLFPNPASRFVSVYFEKMVGKAAKVTIHNSFGHQVFESHHDSLPDAPWRLEFGNLPEGMYLLWIKVDGLREHSVRFVVVNGG
jgi:hypothetical protein